MKLSAALIYEKLSPRVTNCRMGRGFDRLCLGRPEFFAGGAGENGKLYILPPGGVVPDMQKLPESCLICVGEAPEASGRACSVISLPEGEDIFALFNELQAIYDFYDEWDSKLRRCISSRRDMQSIIDISGAVFENPLCFVDSSYRYTAMSDGARYGAETADASNLFGADRVGVDREGRDDLTIRRGTNGERGILSAELRSHRKFVMGIILMESRRPFRGSDAALLAHMAEYVLTLFEYNAAMKKSTTLSLVTVFISLLDDQTVLQTDLSSALSVFDWQIGDSYEVYYLKLPSDKYDYNYLTSEGRQIEKLLPSALAIAYGGDIVLVHNLSGASESEPTVKLHEFLRKRDLACGRSRVFHDITELRLHYEQAVYALTHGTEEYPNKLFHRFSDCSLGFMLENCVGTQKKESLISNGLTELIEHDRRHGTQYMETLTAYCDRKFNATHAADELHIHRTTFLERLKHIREIVDTDFESPLERLHLLMSIELLRTPGEE